MKKRLTYLDGLRGLAALVVVLHHFTTAFYPAIIFKSAEQVHTNNAVELFIYSTPLNIFVNGNFAVYIFTILSGFALSVQYFRDKNIQSLTEISIKRYFRLLPPVVFVNVLVFIILKMRLDFNHVASLHTKSFSWLDLTWNFKPELWSALQQTFVDVFISTAPQPHALNTSLWVLPIFFMGTFLITATLALVGNSSRRYFVYAILIYALLNTFYYSFIVGMILCDLYFSQKGIFKEKKWHPLITLLVIGTGLFLGSYPSYFAKKELIGTIYFYLPKVKLVDQVSFYHIVGATLVIIAILKSHLLQKILNIKPLLFLGKISYSLYVFHVIIVCSLACNVFIYLFNVLPYNKAVGLTVLLTMPVIIIGSYFIYEYVEKPGAHLANLVYRFFYPNKQS